MWEETLHIEKARAYAPAVPLSKLTLDVIFSKIIISKGANICKEIMQRRCRLMKVHHGGKVGKAGRTLASNSSSKSAKSNAGKTLANHKAKYHS